MEQRKDLQGEFDVMTENKTYVVKHKVTLIKCFSFEEKNE